MTARLLSVMYHYVRDLGASRYPRIRGRDLADFVGQLDYLARHHAFVSIDDVVDALDEERPLPPRAALLTFDDGLADHFQLVFPLLYRRGIPAAFYPPSQPIVDHTVLDVHKLHFVLASAPDASQVERSLFAHVHRAREEHRLASDEAYRARCLARPNRWDTPEVCTIKSMLQAELPPGVRADITGALFREFVGVDERAFARELYVDVEQLACMARSGMHIGSHGHRHLWLDRVPEVEQRADVAKSLELLDAIGAPRRAWTMCYPYGGYDPSLVAVIEQLGCRAAVTTEAALARVDGDHRFLLARLDTNDLPCRADAPVARFTEEQRGGLS